MGNYPKRNNEQYWQNTEQRLLKFFQENSKNCDGSFKLSSDKLGILIAPDFCGQNNAPLKRLAISYYESTSKHESIVQQVHNSYATDPLENRNIFNQKAAEVILTSALEAKISLKHVSNRFSSIDPDTKLLKTTNVPKPLVENGKKVGSIILS